MPSTTTVTITESGAQTTTITPSASQEVSVSFAGAGTTYNDASARAAISVVGGSGLSYNSTTGEVSYAQQNLVLSKVTDAGTAAALAHGVAAGNLVRLVEVNNVTKLPALDGSLLTNIPGVTPPTQGIANTNTVKIDSTSVADDEYARFTANGLESRSTSQVLADIGAAASSHNQALSTITGAGTAAALDVPSSGNAASGEVVKGSDTRLTNDRTPVAHSADLVTTGVLGVDRIPTITLSKISDSGTAAALDTGTGSGNVVVLDSNGALPIVDGSNLTNITGTGGLSNVVEDTTPQLGGNLDVQARTITTSTTNGNIVVDPPGSGFLQVEGTTNPGKIRLMCEAGSHGVGLISPTHANSTNATNYDLTLPVATGAANKALIATDSNGTLGWSSALGTAAAAATGDFEASGAIATHNAVTTAHGISAFGATLVDDADAAAARATLGVTNTDSYTGQIETAIDNKTYTIDPRVVADRTITSFYARSGAGTCTATLKNDTATVGVVSVTTNSTTAVISNASVSDGDPITLVISSNQSATDVVFSVEFTQ